MIKKSLLINQLTSLLTDEHNLTANLANASALLMQSISQLNWAGFYLYDKENDELILGPFQGKVACMHIKLGQGVCGTAAANRKPVAVDDVHQFAGYIACDSEANSELVIPLIQHGNLLGVLDLDSPIYNRFDQEITEELSEFCQVLLKTID